MVVCRVTIPRCAYSSRPWCSRWLPDVPRQTLPDIVRALEASKEFSDVENLRKLRAAAKLLESGDKIDSREACSLFSQMAELQGRPPKTTFLVSVIPTRADPKGVSGQMCSVGTFTSVMLADTTGLEDPPPKQ